MYGKGLKSDENFIRWKKFESVGASSARMVMVKRVESEGKFRRESALCKLASRFCHLSVPSSANQPHLLSLSLLSTHRLLVRKVPQFSQVFHIFEQFCSLKLTWGAFVLNTWDFLSRALGWLCDVWLTFAFPVMFVVWRMLMRLMNPWKGMNGGRE